MVRDKTITRSPVREETLWVTHDVIACINIALLYDAMTKGTLCWEVTIQRCLALSLMVGLCCRAGEITVASEYPATNTLLFKHVKVFLEAPPAPAAPTYDVPAAPPRPRFMACFKLHFCKGHRYGRPLPSMGRR
jgi:hypothetical protein